ncbi:MAG: hydrogenase iron-sulfur subunit [Deltaproteobacteria bacterium]|nr:hydrogenase iron-sulfur subunit [Deltaproteobacteria bacterium]
MTNDFEPIIVGFLCNWCSYEGADAAGRARQCYPSNLRVIRVMCSGRVDPQFVFQAFKQGADGVLILGCHPGDCHYKDGNRQALKRYTLIKSMLDAFGIEQDRLRLDWISAAEQEKFVQVVSEMTERVRQLGPLMPRANPLKKLDSNRSTRIENDMRFLQRKHKKISTKARKIESTK